ncbi:GNAT family N-acetyltransferase [Streptomyces sp. NPDC007264]|uniref:GNAT family N-acetyltransferase n=1 Tax=Streptomyces sp. NPDC007264 TaxID=3364777 RepID=UPI0036DB4C5C
MSTVIGEVRDEASLAACVPVVRAAFRTVADQWHLTEEDVPSHPAFITLDRLLEARREGVRTFTLVDGQRLVGCVSVRQSGDGGFRVERLAVLPEQRHRGHGAALMDFACAQVRAAGGRVAAIGIVGHHQVLKRWYEAQGFAEVGERAFPHLPFTVCLMAKRVR